MKTLSGLLKNPHAVTFAVAHWMLIGFLYVEGRTTTDFDSWEIILVVLVFAFDMPVIFTAALLWSPAYMLNQWEVFVTGIFFTSIITVTFQWLVIGRIVINMFSPIQSRMTMLSLKDD